MSDAERDGPSEDGPRKRQRVEPAAAAAEAEAGESLASPLSAELLSHASRAALRGRYMASGPYRHVVLSPLCREEPLRGAFEEMRTHLTGTFKETDLFKLYQTGDLGSMDAADPRLPQLLALRAALYGEAFRDFVRDVTGCGPLSDRVDCSCNLYVRGSHLLCHDDVIGTRRVSYIVYLSEPDEGWAAEDGGCLELYPLAVPGVPGEPALAPTARLLPAWNSMTLFAVHPGVSFHAVQEVLNDSKLRLSVSGWFHAADAPPDARLASLSQLTEAGGGEDAAVAAAAGGAFAPIPSLPPPAEGEALPPPPLSAAEAALLQTWVSPEYLQEALQAKVARRFARDNSLQLRRFLRPQAAAALAAAAAAADAADGAGGGLATEHGCGVGGGWAPLGPPHKQRFLAFGPPAAGAAEAAAAAAEAAAGAAEAAAAGARLQEVRDLFCSAAFAKLLWRLTALRPLAARALARRFRPGLDYTVAHFGALTGPEGRLDASLAFVADAEAAQAQAWASGDVGGFECYLQAEQGGGAAADIYRAAAPARRARAAPAAGGEREGAEAAEPEEEEEEDTLLNVFARSNTLSLVHRDEGIFRFVRYVSASAPSSRWDVSAEYRIAVPDEGDDDDDDDEEEEEEEDEEEEEEGEGAGAGGEAGPA